MKEKIKKVKLRKIPLLILIITTIFLILGILFLAIISKSNKELVTETLNNFFKNISAKKINTNIALFNSLSNNMIVNITIWLLGISIIGIPIILLILSTKSFILGFSISSIIYNYGIKGIILTLIYIVPHIMNLFITILLSYYSIHFSIMLFNLLFRKQEYSKKRIVNRYIKILIFSTIAYITSSVIEVYVIPKLLFFI